MGIYVMDPKQHSEYGVSSKRTFSSQKKKRLEDQNVDL
jgi:hypothetical protein